MEPRRQKRKQFSFPICSQIAFQLSLLLLQLARLLQRGAPIRPDPRRPGGCLNNILNQPLLDIVKRL